MTDDEKNCIAQMRRDLLRARKDLASLQSGCNAEFTSQYGEDLLAWNLLGRPKKGFFVEAGAFDGYTYSVTHALEQMGWRGVLVEPLMEKASECGTRRVFSSTFNVMLGRENSGQCMFYESSIHPLLSSCKPGPVTPSVKSVRKVAVATLDSLLRDVYRPGDVDLLVLDVEGGELDALAGFDLKMYRPRLMIIEDNSYGKDPALRAYLSRYPYQFCGHFECNQIYLRNDQEAAMERLKWMVN